MNVNQIAKAAGLVETRNKLLELRKKLDSVANIEFNIYFNGYSTVDSRDFLNITGHSKHGLTDMIATELRLRLSKQIDVIEGALKEMGVEL